MNENSLKLNPDKTEFLNVLSPSQQKRFSTLELNVGGATIQSTKTVKFLGVVLDQHLSMSGQVTAVIRGCNYHLRNIGKVRPLITTNACKDAIAALVTSRLDYCSSMLSGISQHDSRRLQSVQNKAARLVTRTPPTTSITPVLFNLHWLPCHLRSKFRLMVFVYKCLTNSAPVYLKDLVELHTPRRRLRSSTDVLRLSSTVSRNRIREQAFGVAQCLHSGMTSHCQSARLPISMLSNDF